MKDYYQILRVSSSASSMEIKRAYRKLAIQYHPDKNRDPSAKALFQEINEAYDVLSDPTKKSNYDWKGQNPLSDIIQETPPSPPPHRDPAYRRSRPRGNNKSERQRLRELMLEYLPYAMWICRIGLFASCLCALDYVLPYRNKTEEVIERIAVRGPRGQLMYFELVTESGRKIKIYETRIEPNQIIDYELTIFYSTVMSVSLDGNKQTLAYLYKAQIVFPVGVFIISLLGILYRKSTEFAFNAGIVSGVLLIFFLYLVL